MSCYETEWVTGNAGMHMHGYKKSLSVGTRIRNEIITHKK